MHPPDATPAALHQLEEVEVKSTALECEMPRDSGRTALRYGGAVLRIRREPRAMVLGVAVSLGFLYAGLPAASTGTAARVYATYKCTTPVYKPADIVPTCGSANFYFENLRWSAWTTTAARATGRLWRRSVGGDYHVEQIPGRIELRRVRYCPAVHRSVFTQLRYTLFHAPSGEASAGTLVLLCIA